MSYTPPTPPFPFDNMFMGYNYYTGFTQAGFTMIDLDVLESGSEVYWYGNTFITEGNNQKVFHNKAISWLNRNGYTASTPLLNKTINKYETTFNSQTITGDTYNDVCNLVYSAAMQLTPF
jgi:hypothetical protein